MEIGKNINSLRDICFTVPIDLSRINSFHATGFFPYPLRISKNSGFLIFSEGHRKRPVVYGFIHEEF